MHLITNHQFHAFHTGLITFNHVVVGIGLIQQIKGVETWHAASLPNVLLPSRNFSNVKRNLGKVQSILS